MLQEYQQLAAHLAAALPELQWIDRDKGQLENPEAFHSIVLPGLLLGFGPVEWEGLSMGSQQGQLTLTVSLVLRLPVATHQKQLLTEYDEAAQLTTKVHQALPAFISVWERRSSRDYFTQNFYVVEQTYDFRVEYCKPIQTIPKPNPDIQATLKLPLLP